MNIYAEQSLFLEQVTFLVTPVSLAKPSHARRGEISQSDRVELLHMGARDKLKEKRISEKFREHRGH